MAMSIGFDGDRGGQAATPAVVPAAPSAPASVEPVAPITFDTMDTDRNGDLGMAEMRAGQARMMAAPKQ